MPWPRRAAEWPCVFLEPQAFQTTPITPLRFVLGRATRGYFRRSPTDTEKTWRARCVSTGVATWQGSVLALPDKALQGRFQPAAVTQRPAIAGPTSLVPASRTRRDPGGTLALHGKHLRQTTLALAGKPPVAPVECVSASCRLRRPRLASNRGHTFPHASRLEPHSPLRCALFQARHAPWSVGFRTTNAGANGNSRRRSL